MKPGSGSSDDSRASNARDRSPARSGDGELEDAAAWYENRREGLGHAFTHEVMMAAAKIGQLPEAWSRWPGSTEFRVVRVKRFPYHLPYALRGDRAVVMAVAHDKRRRGYWLEDRALDPMPSAG